MIYHTLSSLLVVATVFAGGPYIFPPNEISHGVNDDYSQQYYEAPKHGFSYAEVDSYAPHHPTLQGSGYSNGHETSYGLNDDSQPYSAEVDAYTCQSLGVVNDQFVNSGVFIRAGSRAGPPFQSGNPHNPPYSMTVLQKLSAPIIYPGGQCDLPPGYAVLFVFKPYVSKHPLCSYAFDGNTNVRIGNPDDNRCISVDADLPACHTCDKYTFKCSYNGWHSGYNPGLPLCGDCDIGGKCFCSCEHATDSKHKDAPDLNRLQKPSISLKKTLNLRSNTLNNVDLATGKVYSPKLLEDQPSGTVNLKEFTSGMETEALINPTNKKSLTFETRDILALALVHPQERGDIPASITVQQVRKCASSQVEKPKLTWITDFNPNGLEILEFSNVAVSEKFTDYSPFVARYRENKKFKQPSTYFSCWYANHKGGYDKKGYDKGGYARGSHKKGYKKNTEYKKGSYEKGYNKGYDKDHKKY